MGIARFNDCFDIIPAVSDQLKDDVYRLRYQSFCIENTTFDLKDYPDKREIDKHDVNSVHYLIRHRATGEYAATTRLILPDLKNIEKLFPLEEHSKIDKREEIKSINRAGLGEISRFCISKTFKNGSNSFSPLDRRMFKHISSILMACVVRASKDNNINYIYVTSEPAWFRFVKNMGIDFIKIGPLAENHGKRYPAIINVNDMMESVRNNNPELFLLFTGKTINILSVTNVSVSKAA